MTDFVLDNSVTMRWLLNSGKKSDQAYAETVLKGLLDATAVVPNLWHLEVVNVLTRSAWQGELNPEEMERFISQLEGLPIRIDPSTARQAFRTTIILSKDHNLSSYDAAYLELAIREGLPLATLDKSLVKAARNSDVDLYLK